jgi:hypothetical protein
MLKFIKRDQLQKCQIQKKNLLSSLSNDSAPAVAKEFFDAYLIVLNCMQACIAVIPIIKTLCMALVFYLMMTISDDFGFDF